MKIYLETKDKDAHRIVFASDRNGKGIYFGEFVRRKADALKTLENSLRDLEVPELWLEGYIADVIERPYKPGAFARNAGPKSKSTTKKKK